MRRSREMLNAIRELNTKVERLDAAIITRYPDSERAADEYMALRKAVNASASASTLHRQNLISLVNALDEGASTQTIREKLCDLLSTLSMTEIRYTEISSVDPREWSRLFEEVGDRANPRSAWVHQTDESVKVIQHGYVQGFPERPEASDSPGSFGAMVGGKSSAVHEEEVATDIESAEMANPQEDGNDGSRA